MVTTIVLLLIQKQRITKGLIRISQIAGVGVMTLHPFRGLGAVWRGIAGLLLGQCLRGVQVGV